MLRGSWNHRYRRVGTMSDRRTGWHCWVNILLSFCNWWFELLFFLVGFKDFLQRRQWHPTPVHLSGKSHGWRSLVGCSPWGREESDTTERLHFHFSLSCIGEGNGSPLQCSCLENPRDGGAWWAAVYRVTQSRTRLKRLSSSSSSKLKSRILVYMETVCLPSKGTARLFSKAATPFYILTSNI